MSPAGSPPVQFVLVSFMRLSFLPLRGLCKWICLLSQHLPPGPPVTLAAGAESKGGVEPRCLPFTTRLLCR